MRLLIDTNIFIYREGQEIVPEELCKLEKKLNEEKIQILVHPESLDEVKRDPDGQRRKARISKIETYPVLECSGYVFGGDSGFDGKIGEPKNENDRTDNSILYSVYRNAVDYLVTNDAGIIKKAAKLGLSERVLGIEEALDLFRTLYPALKRTLAPPAIREVPLSELNLGDRIFDSLKEEYYDFSEWFVKKSREGRKAWINRNEDGTLGAVMSYKLENEAIELSDRAIPAKKRVKVSLLKSEKQGEKLGEQMLKLAFDYAIKNGAYDLYLTHRTKEADPLEHLIGAYGFYPVGTEPRYQDEVFYKRIYPEGNELAERRPVELNRTIYPAYYDGTKVRKFLIPIKTEYHEKLFTEQPRTPKLSEFSGELMAYGNAITKAYLCHAKIRKISPGDIVLFYQSGVGEITCVGTVEEVHVGQEDKDEIRKIVGKRTVYSAEEISEMAMKPTLIILFRWHCNLRKPAKYSELKEKEILCGPPQSIAELTEEQYGAIKGLGGIGPKFAYR